jgi:hypothetical protein
MKSFKLLQLPVVQNESVFRIKTHLFCWFIEALNPTGQLEYEKGELSNQENIPSEFLKIK